MFFGIFLNFFIPHMRDILWQKVCRHTRTCTCVTYPKKTPIQKIAIFNFVFCLESSIQEKKNIYLQHKGMLSFFLFSYHHQLWQHWQQHIMLHHLGEIYLAGECAWLPPSWLLFWYIKLGSLVKCAEGRASKQEGDFNP